MVATRRKRGQSAEVEAAIPVSVTVEADEGVPADVAEEVAEIATAAAEEVAEAAKEVAPDGLAAQIHQADAKHAGEEEAIEEAVVKQTTTVTEESPGTYAIETTQVMTDEGKPDNTSTGASQPAADVPQEAINQAVNEAVQAAEVAAEETGGPAVAQVTVEVPNSSETKPMTDADPSTPDHPAPAAGDSAANGSTGGQQARLFVGCVPHTFTEQDLKPYFQEVGPVREVSILRDQFSGSSRGCAFAIFDDKATADAAIEKLDKKFTLPGATQPMEVRFARETNKVQPVADPNDRNQLFYARAPPTATEQEIKEIFAEFGEVTEFALFMNRTANVSKGCGFVFYKERHQAQAAIDSLHNQRTMTNGFAPLTVKWADPNLFDKKRRAAEDADPNKDNNQVFFARIPRTITEEAIAEVFKTAGQVKEVVLFKTHASATVNKGCGIVTMQTHDDAVKVLEQLDNTHTFEGMDVAMVLKWVDQDLQKRRKMEHDVGRGPPGAFAAGGFGGGGGGGWQQPPPYAGGPPSGGGAGGGGFGEEERPPSGCDRDTFKLYLAGIPKTWELDKLRQVVEQYGQVMDMNLVRDKMTKEPKGVAFMWFKTRAQAERAINQLSGQSFDDGFGGRRTVSVSKARPRRTMTAGGPPPGPAFGQSPPPYQGGGGYGGGGYGRGGGGGYGGGRPPAPAQYQQPAPYYQQQQPPAYDPYPQQPPPQVVQQPPQQAYGGYQTNSYQQPSYQQPPPQQQPAPAYNYSQQAPPPAAAYPPPSSGGGYGGAPVYNPPPAQVSGYGPPSVAGPPVAAPAYAAPAYEPQPQQAPSAYGASQQQYAPPPTQGGYNYSAPPPTAAQQPDYASAGRAQPAGPSQYTYSAPAQGYAPPSEGGYNYGPAS